MVAQGQRKAARSGKLPRREPTIDEVEGLVTWVLRRAASFVNETADAKARREVHQFLAHLTDEVRRFEHQLRLATAPNGERDLPVTRKHLLLHVLRGRLERVFTSERHQLKNRVHGKTEGRTWRRLQCFELSTLPPLTVAQMETVANFPHTLQTKPSQLAAQLIGEVYGRGAGLRTLDGAHGQLAEFANDPDVEESDLGYGGPAPTDGDVLRFVVERVLFGGRRASSAIESAWVAAHEPTT